MRPLLPLLALLFAAPLAAEHITDRLQAPLYPEPNKQKPAIKQIPSGTPVEVLEAREKYAKIRLGEDVQGWVERDLITKEKPLKAQVVELQARNDELQKELEQLQADLAQAKAHTPSTQPPPAPAPATPAAPAAEGQGAAECPGQLDAAKGEIDLLTRQMAQQKNPNPELAVENRHLRDRIEEASRLLSAPLPTPSPMSEMVLDLSPPHLMAAGLLALIGFIAGVLYRNYRLRRRYLGMRL